MQRKAADTGAWRTGAVPWRATDGCGALAPPPRGTAQAPAPMWWVEARMMGRRRLAIEERPTCGASREDSRSRRTAGRPPSRAGSPHRRVDGTLPTAARASTGQQECAYDQSSGGLAEASLAYSVSGKSSRSRKAPAQRRHVNTQRRLHNARRNDDGRLRGWQIKADAAITLVELVLHEPTVDGL